MGYVEKVLQPEETVIYETTVHWFIYLHAAAWAVLALIAVIASFQFETDGAAAMRWIALGLAAIAAVLGFVAWVQRMTTELAITSRRVIFKSGLLQRNTFEMNRSKVESVNVTQGVFGRIFGYGRVELKGTGASDQTLPVIHDPLRFRSYITAG